MEKAEVLKVLKSYFSFALVFTDGACSQTSACTSMVWEGAGQPVMGKHWLRSCLGKLDASIAMTNFTQLY